MLHPKRVRRRLLKLLYDRYMADPLDMMAPEDFIQDHSLAREELLPNMYYLHDRGYVEVMRGYNPPMFAAARITANGIDLVENRFEFNLRFPPAPDELEEAMAAVPVLLERLVEEADLSPLDGEARQALLRDVQYLRDEVARPSARWRTHVVRHVISWIEGRFEEPEKVLPSLPPLKDALREHLQ